MVVNVTKCGKFKGGELQATVCAREPKNKSKLELQAVMNGGQAPPHARARNSKTAEPTKVGPKGCRARGKSEDTGQHLSRCIRCNGKCTGSAKG